MGNVVALVDADSGAVAESYRYTAYGEATIYDNTGAKAATSPLANPWRFASKRHDDETGLIFFGKRYYNAETGRWTTPDPRGFADGPNLYAYVHNNPLTLFDLYGEFSIFELLTNLFSGSSVDATNNSVSIGRAAPMGQSNSHSGNGWNTNNATYNAPYYAGFIPGIMREKIAVDEIPEYTVVGDVDVPDATIFYHNGINTSHERALEQGKALSKAHGNAKVYCIPNRSYGFCADLGEFYLNAHGIVTNNVRRSASVMKKVIGERATNSNHTVYDYGYSHGALIAGWSYHYLPKEMRTLIVGRMLSPGYILPNGDIKQVDNYIPGDDLVSSNACKHNQQILADPDPVGYNVHRLPAGSGVGFIGHDFFHQSLQGQIKEFGDRFKENYGLL